MTQMTQTTQTGSDDRNGMAISDTPPLPTVAQLVRAIGIAVMVATVILVIAVLPAEYGIDPTGIGQAHRAAAAAGLGDRHDRAGHA